MPEPTRNEDPGGLGAWVLVGQLGVVISAPIVAAVWAGVYFEVGGGAFMGLVLLGVAAGMYGGYRIVKPFLR